MEQRPAIFKLNLDCFDHVFDYLALRDLGRFSQTCKAIKAAVGEYYEANYGTIEEYGLFEKDNLYLHHSTMGYSDFVQKLSILTDAWDECVNVKRDLSRKVIEVAICPAGYTEPDLRRLEYILNNAEVLDISGHCTMSQSVYELVPTMCVSLKRLHMIDFEYDNAAQTQDGNKWLLREYPTLKHLEWTQSEDHGYKINEIKAFFERNPNVRSFATNVDCLCESQQLIIESGVKLDDLTIDVDNNDPKIIRDFCILLNELHEKGVYKRLHLKFRGYFGKFSDYFVQQTVDQIISINAVRSMSLTRVFNINWSNLVNLVELQITFCSLVMSNVEIMARQLVNLERVHLGGATLDEMVQFIYHSVKLKKLKVDQFGRDVSALDLANMNKRREQLLNARKVTIFIDEEVYLATKWASKITDFRLIEMRRDTAHDWGHHFGLFPG